MRHGYTNRTDLSDGEVHKHYEGPDAPARLAVELRALTRLAEVMPIPTVIARSQTSLVLSLIPGEHGQDLIEAGRAEAVLTGCGELLQRLHQLPPATLRPDSTTGVDPAWRLRTEQRPLRPRNDAGDCLARLGVLRHRRRHRRHRVVRLDRAHASPGSDGCATEVLRGLRLHTCLGEAAISLVDRCSELEQFCRRWDPDGPGEQLWRDRAVRTASWAC